MFEKFVVFYVTKKHMTACMKDYLIPHLIQLISMEFS